MSAKEKTYEEFLLNKTVLSGKHGFEVGKLNSNLFDFQEWIVRRAIEHGRYAIFADTGLGKTLMQLSWAYEVKNKTGKPVIVLCPLAVEGQTIEEGSKFGVDVKNIMSDGNIIFIDNYEQLDNVDTTIFGGVVLDESSILKGYNSSTKEKLILKFKDTPYKLACTATPAPNDPIEFGNHSEFLGVMDSATMVSIFFINDVLSKGRNSKWRLKRHAVKDFYRWVASWSCVVSNPSDIGFAETGKSYILPHMHIDYVEVQSPKQDNGKLFNDVAVSATEFHKELRKTIIERCDIAIKKARETDDAVLMWITSNEEEDYIRDNMPEARIVTGSDKKESKQDGLLGFKNGKYRVLVTKGKIARYGLNYQHCHRQIFVSFDFSFENMYQMMRRSWRFGQKSEVEITLIYSDTMGNVKEEIERKHNEFEEGRKMIVEMAKQVHVADIESCKEFESEHGEAWTLYNADCVEVAKSMEDESVDYTIFSPPFADLYSYSDDARDMSNNSTYGEFFEHFAFIVDELNRVLRSGRICTMHVTNLSTTISRDGVAQVIDFRGDVIRFMTSRGWLYFGENIIWKDPRPMAQRTKAQSLLHATTKKDSSKNRSCFPDYMLHFKKRGENTKPICKNGQGIDFDYWGKIAEPVWMDINGGETLKSSKEQGDEKHMTPTQLEPLRRCIELYSDPDEIIFSPFNGVGSEGVVSIQKGRKYIGAELKTEYFKLATENLIAAEMTNNQLSFL